MTDENLSDLCDSILFMRTLNREYRGALVRHLQLHGKKSLVFGGYIFRLVPVSGNPWFPQHVDLRIDRVPKAKAA